MLCPTYTRQFERDLKKMLKRGNDKKKIKKIIRLLVLEEQLPQTCRDHKLAGNYQGRRDCHIEPDWLLIYKYQEQEIVFERTGSHSDLFKK
jgi:mRNA interferase YafQ